MKQFLKDNVVPPGLVRLANRMRSDKGAGKPVPRKLSLGTPSKGIRLRHAFQNARNIVVEAVTRGSFETRTAAKVPSGATFTIGPFEPDITYLQFGLTTAQEGGRPRDVRVCIDGIEQIRLEGRLPIDRWTDVRVPIKGQKSYQLHLEFEDADILFLANPIGGGSKRPARNVIVIIADALLPDMVGCYNGDRNRPSPTPNIDRFFAPGHRYTNAYTQSEWTLPSIASMATGLYSIQHGVYNPKENPRQLPLDVPTFPELLRATGYHTLGISAQGRYTAAYGHHRGYDRFIFSPPREGGNAVCTTRDGMEFMEAHKDGPFFCCLHYFEPHPPFTDLGYLSGLLAPPNRLADCRETFSGLTDKSQRKPLQGEFEKICLSKVKELDFHLGSLFNYLEFSGLIETSLVFLLADHGNSYDYMQIPLLRRNATHIPFLIRDPDIDSGTFDGFIEPCVDIYPTILARAQLPVPDHAVGIDLLDRTASERQQCLAESAYNGKYEAMLRDNEWIYFLRCAMDPISGDIYSEKKEFELLFRSTAYPGVEDYTTNLAKDHGSLVEVFQERVLNHTIHAPRYFDERSFL